MTNNMTMEQRKVRVAELAARFKRDEGAYKEAAFNEASTRGQFLNAFLEALGWDVGNAAGARRGYESVVVEDNVAIDGGVKHTDYTLCIGGTKRLVIEAKKPAVHIKTDSEPAIQGRRYSRTLKLPVVIVTNFAEWAVYDAGVKLNPRKDTAATARMEYLTCEQYADKFEELYSRFSFDAVLKGDFAAWCGDTSDKRGTETVDDEFLGMIERWREMLALSIARRNAIDDDTALTAAVQRIIDRIVFLRIAEGKGIETFGALRDAAGRDGAYKSLNTLFARANDKYNAGLFAPDKNNDVEALSIEDRALRDILGELYEPDCHYDFAALPVEILGSVYERFLGRVVRLGRRTAGGHSVKVEDKPEVQKAGGVYYTPDYIVDYIVRESIGRATEGKTAEEVAAMHFCDPACGSGSFLVGAYRYLLDWHLTYYTQDEAHIKKAVKEKRIYEAASSAATSGTPVTTSGTPVIARERSDRSNLAEGRDCFTSSQAGRNRNDGAGGIYRLSIAEKKRILTANIYGVDIDAQAVEVTKLSLFLKILEDEEAGVGELFRFSDTIQGKILPSMECNIKCGNSLIGSDYWTGKNFELFGNKEIRAINAFDWQSEFPAVFAPSVIAREHSDRSNLVEGRDCFTSSARGQNRLRSTPQGYDGAVFGFDCVIGNPPYLRVQGLHEHHEETTPYIESHYKVATGRYDFYILFMERALRCLLRKGGTASFILPHKFTNSSFGKGMRALIAEDKALKYLVHFGEHQVFEKASVYTCIIGLQAGCDTFRFAKAEPALLSKGVEYQTIKEAALTSAPWAFSASSEVQETLDKMREMPLTLEDIAEYCSQGTVSMGDDIYLLRGKVEGETFTGHSDRLDAEVTLEAAIMKPLLKGDDVKRYAAPHNTYWEIYPHHLAGTKTVPYEKKELKTQFPMAYAYLKQFKKELVAKKTKYKTNPVYWYALHCPRNITMFEQPKIITPEISLGCNMTYETKGLYHNTKVYTILLKEEYREQTLAYLAILNSSTMWFFLSHTGYVLRGGYFCFKTNYMKPFPLPRLDDKEADVLAGYARTLMTLKARGQDAAVERQIKAVEERADAEVRALYGAE